MFVLDASVMLKWFMDEVDTDKANAIKNDHVTGKLTITIPDLAIYEVGNALRYEPEFSIEEVNKCLQELYDLDTDIIVPLPEIIPSVTKVAYENGVTFYDAFYIALAKELNLQFITADEKLYSKVKHLPFVQLLNKLETAL